MSTTPRSARRLRLVSQTELRPDIPTSGSPQAVAGRLIQLAATDVRPGVVADQLLVAATTNGAPGIQYALDVAEACARLAAHFLTNPWDDGC